MSKLIYKPRKAIPSCVADFSRRTASASDTVRDEMGQMQAEIPDRDFERLCLQFASGVQYVSDKYHCSPDSIIFRDHLDRKIDVADNGQPLTFNIEEEPQALYDPNEKEIRISRAWFKDILLNPEQEFLADGLHDRYPIRRDEYVFLVGVEEAIHHKQAFGGARAQRKGNRTIDGKLDDDAYWDDPQELEARKEVLQAARELSIIKKRSRA